MENGSTLAAGAGTILAAGAETDLAAATGIGAAATAGAARVTVRFNRLPVFPKSCKGTDRMTLPCTAGSS